MLFKMLGIERTCRKLGGPKVRQVFVTQSRVLADRVEEYFNDLIQSCDADSQTVEELEWRAAKRKEVEKTLMELDEEDDSSSNLPSRFSELDDRHFPLFLTFDKVRHSSFVMIELTPTATQLCKLFEAELAVPGSSREEDSRRMVIGKRFCLADASDVDFTLEDHAPPLKSTPKLFSSSSQKILYEDFRANYWPHFPQSSTKGLGLSPFS
jgi:hypothetical protein